MALLKKLLAWVGDDRSKEKQQILQRAYRKVFSGDDGELVLADLVEQSGLVLTGSIKGLNGETVLNDTLVAIGKRDIVLGILRRLHKDHNKIIQQLIKEIENE